MNQPLDAAAPPTLNAPAPPVLGVAPDAVQAAIQASVHALKNPTNGRDVDGVNVLRNLPAAGTIERASLQVAEALGPATIAQGQVQQPATQPSAQEQNILSQVLSPDALALLQGRASAPQVPGNAVATPTPTPPAPPAPSAQEVAIQQLAQAMQQQAAIQQAQYQHQLAMAQQQALAQQQAAVQSWRDPSVRERALQQAGLAPDDPSAQFMYQTYHQAQDELAQTRAIIQQQQQAIQQLSTMFGGLQAQAQQITMQGALSEQVGKEFQQAPEQARQAVVQNALALVRTGLDPVRALEQASAPLRFMLAGGARPAPTSPQIPADVTAGIALRGASAAGLPGIAPAPGRGVPSLNDLARSLPQLDQMVAQGFLRR